MKHTHLSSELTLRTWAKQNHITPAQFAQTTGYSYSHAWQLLSGRVKVTPETLGRVLLNYGPAAAESLARTMRAAPVLEETAGV